MIGIGVFFFFASSSGESYDTGATEALSGIIDWEIFKSLLGLSQI